MKENGRKALGYVWIKNQRRPFYAIRQIRRGENKGRFEVEYRHSATIYRKQIVDSKKITNGFGE